MATFADLMSLLLTFFVLLLSFASMDSIKFMGMVGSIRYAFGIDEEVQGQFIGLSDDIMQSDQLHIREQKILDSLSQSLKAIAKKSGLQDGVNVSIGQDGVRMRIPGDLLFEGGTSAISPIAFQLLDQVARRTRSGHWRLTVEGHADAQLAADRAISTVEYLAEAGRVPRELLTASSYSDTRPVSTNGTAEGRRQNRRVELLFRPPEDPDI
jgi:chemotaxis protein MotB